MVSQMISIYIQCSNQYSSVYKIFFAFLLCEFYDLVILKRVQRVQRERIYFYENMHQLFSIIISDSHIDLILWTQSKGKFLVNDECAL